MERCAKIKVGEPQWFLDDHLRLFSRTPVSAEPVEDGIVEVLWNADDEENDIYFRRRTYCDKRMLNRQQESFNTRKAAVAHAKRMATERMEAAEKDMKYWKNLIANM